MKLISMPRFCISFCIGTSVLVGCIQTMGIDPPQDPRQLPSDIFKLHIHLQADPLSIEVPLVGGQTVKLSAAKTETDPQTDYLRVIETYEIDPARHNSFVERNDYAASLLFAGKFPEAVPVLVQLENDYPGQYSTSANLGTAYELVGELGKALEWIKISIARNAQSHRGTEWLHVAIIEAKQKLRRDSNWLDKHTVLEGHEEISREIKEEALEYQLNERLYFIHEKDPVMSDLFYQAALVTSDPMKKAYFLRQVPLFSSARDWQLKMLSKKL